ncbi:glucose-6-phosphate dehydrogenase assembly protein OpcA [Nocardioides pacificus]
MIELEDTSAAGIAAELVQARKRAGSPAMGMVMTLVVVADEDGVEAAMEAAREATHEHPARVLVVILGDGRRRSRVDARVGNGGGWTGEVALIRLSGEVIKHAESVVLPLLLPDSPVVVWWSCQAPLEPGEDPIGRLGQRRITDVTCGPSSAEALLTRCRAYSPGSTDLTWTRITPWRALLAGTLDQHHEKVRAVEVTAARDDPSADLLAGWLADRLRVEVTRHVSQERGIREVVMETRSGPVRITRRDEHVATLSTPGQPDRTAALRTRGLAELLAEELRRLDEDDVYAATVRHLAASTRS